MSAGAPGDPVRRRRPRWVAAAAAAALLGGGLVLLWPHAQHFSQGLPPDQFHRALDPELAARYPEVLGVAHNAANRLDTLAVALEHGADVVEADVISVRGELVAGRDQPLGWLSNHLFRGPTLAEVWDAAAAADVLKLDLKRDDEAFLDDLVAFLAPRQGDREVMVSSRDRAALLRLHRDLPDVTLLFSIGFPEGVRQVRADAELQRAIAGVSVFQGLVDSRLVGWADDRDLLVLAWPVNDAATLATTVRRGADGITTANLAVLEALA